MSAITYSVQEIRDSLTEPQLVACTMLGEARGDAADGSSVEEQLGVGCVIRRRVQTPKRFGRSYRTVCLARGQFSCWWRWGGESNYEWVHARATALALDHDEPDQAVHALVVQAVYLAEGVVSGVILDVVRGADHYMTESLFKTDTVVWAKGLAPIHQIGGHVFFRGVA